MVRDSADMIGDLNIKLKNPNSEFGLKLSFKTFLSLYKDFVEYVCRFNFVTIRDGGLIANFTFLKKNLA